MSESLLQKALCHRDFQPTLAKLICKAAGLPLNDLDDGSPLWWMFSNDADRMIAAVKEHVE